MIQQMIDFPARLVVQQVALALLHALWQGALIGAAVAVIMRLLRDRVDESQPDRMRCRIHLSRANLRYALSCVALLLIAISPGVNLLVFAKSTPGETETADRTITRTSSSSSYGSVLSPGEGKRGAANSPDPGGSGVLDTRRVTGTAVFHSGWFSDSRQLWLGTFFWGWVIGVMLLSSWHLVGWAMAQRLSRCGVVGGDGVSSVVRRLAGRLGIKRPIGIRLTAGTTAPAVVGWLRPLVVLPASLVTGLAPRELEALLAHELAHIRRHDYLVNLVQSTIETLLFYHPVVWWVSRCIRVEREYCTDDLAMSLGEQPEVYARSLLSAAEFARMPKLHAVAASGGRFSARIRRILAGPPVHTTTQGRSSAWAAVVLVASFTLMVTALAQDRQLAEGPNSATAISRFETVLDPQTDLNPEVTVRSKRRVTPEGKPADSRLPPVSPQLIRDSILKTAGLLDRKHSSSQSTDPQRREQTQPAWGDSREGVQVGLSQLGERRRFQIGQRVPLGLHIRNVGSHSLRIEYTRDFERPTVLDESDKSLPVARTLWMNGRSLSAETLLESISRAAGISTRAERQLKPGETVVLAHPGLMLGLPPKREWFSSLSELKKLNQRKADPDVVARVEAYELAFQLQAVLGSNPDEIWSFLRPYLTEPATGRFRITQSSNFKVTRLDGEGRGTVKNVAVTSGAVPVAVGPLLENVAEPPEPPKVYSQDFKGKQWKDVFGWLARQTNRTVGYGVSAEFAYGYESPRKLESAELQRFLHVQALRDQYLIVIADDNKSFRVEAEFERFRQERDRLPRRISDSVELLEQRIERNHYPDGLHPPVFVCKLRAIRAMSGEQLRHFFRDAFGDEKFTRLSDGKLVAPWGYRLRGSPPGHFRAVQTAEVFEVEMSWGFLLKGSLKLDSGATPTSELLGSGRSNGS